MGGILLNGFDMKALIAVATSAAFLALPANAATLYSQFTFDTVADDLGNSVGSGSGTIAGGEYVHNGQQGWNVNLGQTLTSWSIVMDITVDDIGGYRKIIDFFNGGRDAGLYLQNGEVRYYPAPQRSGFIGAGIERRVAMTFNSGVTTFYQNGVKLWDYTNSGSDYVSDLTQFYVAQDDSLQTSETSSGAIDFISVFDGALTDAEVAAINGPTAVSAVPLPAGAVLMLTGLGALSTLRRKRVTTES